MATAEARMSRRARMVQSKLFEFEYFDFEILACKDSTMAARRRTKSTQDQYREAVAAYVAAGGDESVQRVITAVYSLTRKLDQWYTRQLADLDLSHGEWSVLAHLATSDDSAVTPSRLADV